MVKNFRIFCIPIVCALQVFSCGAEEKLFPGDCRDMDSSYFLAGSSDDRFSDADCNANNTKQSRSKKSSSIKSQSIPEKDIEIEPLDTPFYDQTRRVYLYKYFDQSCECYNYNYWDDLEEAWKPLTI